MHPRLLSVVLGLGLVSALLGCGDRSDPGGDTAAAGRGGSLAAAALFLVPPAERARVGEALPLVLHGGARLADAAAVAVAPAFDHVMARVGGWQHNELGVAAAGGRVVVEATLPEAGDALVGFSTPPEEVVAGGRTLWLQRHGKSLLFASSGPGDVPEPSAAASARIGQALEIVPFVDPLPLLDDADLPLQVRWQGPGLPGAVLELEYVPATGGEPQLARATTGESGVAHFRIRGRGRYLARVVHVAGDEAHIATAYFAIGGKR